MGYWSPEARAAYRKHNAEKLREDAKRRRREDPEKWKAIHKKSRKRLDDVVYTVKNNPCVDCGNRFPACVMQFDHVRGDKIADIAQLRSVGNLQKLLEEIEKCELVCANCHAIRTCVRDTRPKTRQCDCVAIGGLNTTKQLPEGEPEVIEVKVIDGD